MKKASKILLILGGAFSLVSILGLFITGVVFIVQATMASSELMMAFEELVKEIDPSLDAEGLKELAMVFYFFCLVVPMFWCCILSIISAILCFVGAGAQKKGLYIAIIVFCFLLLRMQRLLPSKLPAYPKR